MVEFRIPMTNTPEEATMPLTAHLEELRVRLIRCLIVVGIGFFVCYAFKDYLFEIITTPLFDVMPKNSYMIYTGVAEGFFTYLEIAFFASLFLTGPFILYQIWRFISPALYKKERRYAGPFVVASTLLFVGGILFGYYLALPPAFGFFVEFSSDTLKPMFSFKEYLPFALKMLLGFGISFELPVFMFFLAKMGVVNSKMLSKQRRYAILIIFIAAAVLTPSADVVTQVIMAVPLLILYEASIYIVKFARKKPAETNEQEETTTP